MPPVKRLAEGASKKLYDWWTESSDRGLNPLLRAFNKAVTYPVSGLGDPLIEYDSDSYNRGLLSGGLQSLGDPQRVDSSSRDNTRELTAYYLDLIERPDYLVPTKERPMDAPKYETLEDWYRISDENITTLDYNIPIDYKEKWTQEKLDNLKIKSIPFGGRDDKRPYNFYRELARPAYASGNEYDVGLPEEGNKYLPSTAQKALSLKEGESMRSDVSIHPGIDLGRYTKSIGRDKEGIYASLFDVWDFNPDEYDYGWEQDEPRPESGILKNLTDPTYVQPWLMDQVGKPFAVYNRFYLDEDKLSDVVDSVNYKIELSKLQNKPNVTAKELFEFQQKNNKWQTTE
jgi:hypothetical protein